MTTASGTQNYTWDAAGDLLMDSSNAYIYAGSGAPAEQVSLAAGTATYLNTDSLGSVRGIVSSAGALTASTSYDAWGNPQTTGGLTAYTPFGYAGAYTDPDGLLYLINRYYNPATGQFISVDPDVAASGQPYGYAGGNPVDNTDPDGLLMMAETGAGVRIGSPQYLERVVPVINYYNPISSQIPRTPAQKRTPPKVRKVVRKAASRHKAKATKPTSKRPDLTGQGCPPNRPPPSDDLEEDGAYLGLYAAGSGTTALILGAADRAPTIRRILAHSALAAALASAAIDGYACLVHHSSCWQFALDAPTFVGAAGGAADSELLRMGKFSDADVSRISPLHGLFMGGAASALLPGGVSSEVTLGDQLTCQPG